MPLRKIERSAAETQVVEEKGPFRTAIGHYQVLPSTYEAQADNNQSF